MTDLRHQWNLEMALEVLKSETIDSKTWAEAVEWLLLFGPPEIKEVLTMASSHATKESFTELKPEGFTEEGQPCYSLSSLADALNIDADEAMQKLSELERESDSRFLFDPGETSKLQ
jgi:hypothetical protein